jgi:hypothetical protein
LCPPRRRAWTLVVFGESRKYDGTPLWLKNVVDDPTADDRSPPNVRLPPRGADLVYQGRIIRPDWQSVEQIFPNGKAR